jgi:hypothetical protein
MKASIFGIALLAATPVLAQQQQQIPAPILFSIKEGETLLLRNLGLVTTDCRSMLQHFDGIDILVGPPEVTLKFEPAKVNVSTLAGKVCETPVSGGNLMISANGVTDQREADLIFRLRYTSQNAPQTATPRYHLLMFPGAEQPATK